MPKGPHLGANWPHFGEADTLQELDWAAIRLFVKVVASESIRGAAVATGHTPRTIRTRIEQLERDLNAVLFERSAKGVILTERGVEIHGASVDALRSMSRIQAHGRRYGDRRSTVRIGITEGLGTFWLMPRLAEFKRANPSVHVKVKLEFNNPDVTAANSDIAVHLQRPTLPDIKVKRLGCLHLVFFASYEYLREYGTPQTKADLVGHTMIEVEGPQLVTAQLHREIIDEDSRDFPGITVNTSSAVAMGVTWGAGIAMLPTYAPVVTHSLQHVVPDERLKVDVWLSYDARSAELPQVRAAIDWIIEAFNASRYPWFGDTYIPPSEIERLLDAKGTRRMFASFRDQS